MIQPKRGDIYLVNFDPTLGAEIRKTRPALILQNDIANKFSPVTIVAAISSRFDDPLYPTEVLISAKARTGLAVDSVVLLNQIRRSTRRGWLSNSAGCPQRRWRRSTRLFALA